MKVRISRGFSEIFLRKIGKLDFLELILDGRIHRLGPRGYGPRRLSPPWTGGHRREPELIGAQPPAPSVVEVAGRGVEEEEGSMGSRFQAHRGSKGGRAVVHQWGDLQCGVARVSEIGQG
jgi:hypothetical protein